MPAAPLIAIVDDEEGVRLALQRLLRSAGIDSVTFANGMEFLSARPELKCVVLDLHMPVLSGFDVMELLPSGLPVIAITGHDSPEARARAGRCAAYLRKPIDGDVLIAAIANTIGRPPGTEEPAR